MALNFTQTLHFKLLNTKTQREGEISLSSPCFSMLSSFYLNDRAIDFSLTDYERRNRLSSLQFQSGIDVKMHLLNRLKFLSIRYQPSFIQVDMEIYRDWIRFIRYSFPAIKMESTRYIVSNGFTLNPKSPTVSLLMALFMARVPMEHPVHAKMWHYLKSKHGLGDRLSFLMSYYARPEASHTPIYSTNFNNAFVTSFVWDRFSRCFYDYDKSPRYCDNLHYSTVKSEYWGDIGYEIASAIGYDFRNASGVSELLKLFKSETGDSTTCFGSLINEVKNKYTGCSLAKIDLI